MYNFIFGVVWTVFVTLMFIMCLFVPGEQRGGADMDFSLLIFFILFELFGLYLLISGLKKIIKDKKTNKYGIQCYGIISEIKKTGTYVNDYPEYKAILNFVNPETNQIETIEEIVGLDYNKYPINSYVLCKYYHGDINIENFIFENEIPGGIKKYLISMRQDSDCSNFEFSSDKEYVTIDGVQYKKI